MAAKTWERDFRYPAIQASIRSLGDAYHDDPFRYPGSFCLPVAERPIVGWTPGRVALVAIVLGFALLGSGVLLGTVADRHAAAGGPFLMALALFCSVAGIVTFFLPAKLDRHIIRRLTGTRGRNLIQRAYRGKIMAAELSDADRSKMKLSIDGDDHLLIVCDEENRRLMIEGIGARYQIRADDVAELLPFEHLNYVGVEIAYRIDSQTSLRIAVARVSMFLELIRQLPFLFFLRGRISNKLLDRCGKTLVPLRSTRLE